MDPIIARKTWRTLEPMHGLIYFAPEAHSAYADLGLGERSGYFASRSAAMGQASDELIIATFFNFNPAVVRQAMASVWDKVSPESILEARHSAAALAIERAIGEAIHSDEIAEAANLARSAAEAASEHPEGRPLFAAHASLDWPAKPHQVLFHAQMLLREFRGDAHIALLVSEGVSGIESLVLHGATGTISPAILQKTRGWSDEAWAEATKGLAERGLVDADGGFTDKGRSLRESIEARTDALSLTPYDKLGEQDCQRLRALVRPHAKRVAESMFPVDL